MRGWLFIALAAGLFAVAPAVARGEDALAESGKNSILIGEPSGDVSRAGKKQDAPVVTKAGAGGDFRVASRTDGAGGSVAGSRLVGVDDAPSAGGEPHPATPARKPASGGKAAGVAPKAAAEGKTAPGAPKAVAAKPATPQALPKPGPLPYRPVADGGGLAFYLANLVRSGAQAGGMFDERIAEFTASKNRYSIEVRLSQRRLYLYENLPDGSRHLARAYTVAVPGRDMEAPQGWGVVTGISFEPWWRPTAAMKERARKQGKELPEVVKPGVKENPMGPFKIILSHGFGFRIHGNNNPGSIGRPVTSGCIRMRNDEGKDLAKLIDVGTEVVFLQ